MMPSTVIPVHRDTSANQAWGNDRPCDQSHPTPHAVGRASYRLPVGFPPEDCAPWASSLTSAPARTCHANHTASTEHLPSSLPQRKPNLEPQSETNLRSSPPQARASQAERGLCSSQPKLSCKAVLLAPKEARGP